MKNYAHFIYMLAKHKKKYFQHQHKSKMKIGFKKYDSIPQNSIISYNILHFTKREVIFANIDLSQNKKTFRK